jgi:hypothetical protein
VKRHRTHDKMARYLTPYNPYRPAEFDPGARKRGSTEAEMNETGETVAQCWCAKGFVGVTLDEVRACTTRSCGRPGCKEKK